MNNATTRESRDFRIDFAGVGVAKSGTSWLARCLFEHPDICLPTNKETNFFCVNHPMSHSPLKSRFRGSSHYSLGMEWYEACFSTRKPGQILGEYSNAYFGDPESPRLLYEHNPRAKLIISYRDPVDASYSLYYQINQYQPLHLSFEELIRNPGMQAYFRYHENTQRFLKYFPREQMLLLLYDDIRADGHAVFSRVCRFLGVDDTVHPPSLTRVVNKRRLVRYKALRDLRCAISAAFGANEFTRRLRKIAARSGIARAVEGGFKTLSLKEGTPEPMRPETREELRAMFRDENSKLAALASLDLEKWNRSDSAG